MCAICAKIMIFIREIKNILNKWREIVFKNWKRVLLRYQISSNGSVHIITIKISATFL